MLKYHNIENFKFPSSEEIFLQPSSYNEYTGYNKYPIYAWWSPLYGIIWHTALKSDGDFHVINNDWLDKELEDDLIQFEVCANLNDDWNDVQIKGITYRDVQFLIKFEWDEGDRSVGIWPGYNVSLILNNSLPIYRTLDYVELC